MSRQRNTLSIEVIRQLFHYDSITGDLSWKEPGVGRPYNVPLRTDNKNGYYRVSVDYNKYFVHRICFAHYHGWWPNEVDHKDRVTTHNWIDNLRPATHSQNIVNGKIRSTNKSGVTGVIWFHRTSKWVASITVDYCNIHLGYFVLKDDAIKARKQAEMKYFGSFLGESQ